VGLLPEQHGPMTGERFMVTRFEYQLFADYFFQFYLQDEKRRW
jgi:hypothetical protein